MVYAGVLPGAVLFESEQGDEYLHIECAARGDGGLALLQESDGDLTEWCFEESPHRVEVEVGQEGVRRLMEYFHLDSARQLPAALRVAYTGYDSGQRIRGLMRRLGIAYEVIEHPIVR